MQTSYIIVKVQLPPKLCMALRALSTKFYQVLRWYLQASYLRYIIPIKRRKPVLVTLCKIVYIVVLVVGIHKTRTAGLPIS